MSGQPAIKALIIYAVCIPLALFLGYQITDLAWMSRESLATVGIVLAVLVTPILLKWHRPILYFTINTGLMAFFVPGRPKLGMVMVALSLTISVLHRILQPRSKFLHAPEIARPVIAVIVVLLFTAFLRGGIGFNAFGGSTVGGSRYAILLLGMLSFFAFTAEPIPEKSRNLYLGLFFLSGVTAVVGDFFSLLPQTSFIIYIYLLFPSVNVSAATTEFEVGATRLFGFTGMAAAFYHFMLAKYGVRGIFMEAKRLRLLIFCGVFATAFLGGFRSVIIHFVLLFFVMFYLEKLYRSRLVVPLILAGVLVASVTVIFLPKMPFVFQRALAFLPVNISPEARMDAAGSSEWRVQMWKAVWPEVPNYLLLGKGLGFAEADYLAITDRSLSRSPDQWMWAVITGDYHSGPLSILLTFGLWGAIAFIWLHISGWRVLVLNFRNGDPSLRIINAFLLTKFVVHMITFWFVAGSMHGDAFIFASLLGFSVSLNGGVCRVPAAVSEPVKATSPTPPRREGLRLRPGLGAPPANI